MKGDPSGSPFFFSFQRLEQTFIHAGVMADVTAITRRYASLPYLHSHERSGWRSGLMEREMTKLKKILTGAAAALTLSIATLSIGTTAAEAGWKHKYYWNGYYAPYYNPYVYGFYGPSGCFVKWTKFGKAYVCI
jgi:hypothetical protein